MPQFPPPRDSTVKPIWSLRWVPGSLFSRTGQDNDATCMSAIKLSQPHWKPRYVCSQIMSHWTRNCTSSCMNKHQLFNQVCTYGLCFLMISSLLLQKKNVYFAVWYIQGCWKLVLLIMGSTYQDLSAHVRLQRVSNHSPSAHRDGYW